MNVIEPIVNVNDFSPEEIQATLTPDTLKKAREFFDNVKVNNGVTVTIARAHLPGIGVVTQYESVIVSRFLSAEGDLWMGLSDGFFVNVSELFRKIEAVI